MKLEPGTANVCKYSNNSYFPLDDLGKLQPEELQYTTYCDTDDHSVPDKCNVRGCPARSLPSLSQ